jgi:hypothetical protein
MNKSQIILNEKGRILARITQIPNYLSSNPKDVYRDISFQNAKYKKLDILYNELNQDSFDLNENLENCIITINDTSLKETNECIRLIENTDVPQELFSILSNNKKALNEKALKNLTLDLSILLNFYFKAYSENKYNYSMYSFVSDNPSSEYLKMPEYVEILDNGTIFKSNEVELPDMQIKNIINLRRCNRVDILEKDKKWHCFYWTWRAILGKENSKIFDCHIHYIDYTWGNHISKEYVLKQLESKSYKLDGIHIKFKNELNENNITENT